MTTITDNEAGYDDGNSINVDGMTDEGRGIQYWGKATKQPDGTWQCLANVQGALCRVEVEIVPKECK